MLLLPHLPFYDPEKSYEENFKDGPFGAFAQGSGNPKGVFIDKDIVQSSTLHNLHNEEPQYNFFGFKVSSPFGIPAGPLINGNFVQAALDKGFDIVIYKTVRSRKYPCHKWPNVLSVKIGSDLTFKKAEGKILADLDFQDALSITNSFGVPSMDPEFWQKDLAKVVKNTRPGQIIVGSFQGTKKPARNASHSDAGGEGQSVEDYINDFRKTAKLLFHTGVKVIEVNLSCPNEGTNNLLCYDTERSVKVVKAIKEEIGKVPLIIKIAYFKNNKTLGNFVKEIGPLVQGISAINTIPAEIVDKNGKQALPGEGRLKSGVCGHAIKWAGLEMVRKLKKLRKELNYSYTIIGVGGVTTPDDFFEYQKAGADIVMSATGAMWNPYLAQEIKEKLR